MNYIVNPWWFYFASIFNSIDTVAILACMVFCALIITNFIFFGDSSEKTQKPFMRKWIIGAAISGVLCILVPDKSDMEKMIMASYVTEENINSATNYGKDIVDYIFDKVNGEDDD